MNTSVPVYDITVGQFITTLTALKDVLRKGKEFAEAKKIDMSVLLQTRLVPDQFPLSRQIQIATDTAKGCVGRLINEDIPVFEDTEQTYEQFVQRIDKTITFLQKFKPEQFKDYEKAIYASKHKPGMKLGGKSFLVQYAIPNFYFHVTTAYTILRVSGVTIGKGDFLGKINWTTE